VTELDWQNSEPIEEIVHVREWGTDFAYALRGEQLTLGTEATCDIRVRDPYGFTSRLHAHLARDGDAWWLRDAGSKNGVWLDGVRKQETRLAAGMELGIGSLRFVVESPRWIALRALMARWVGFGYAALVEVDRALVRVRAYARRRAPLVLSGEGDLGALVRQIHERTGGGPFVRADPRKPASVENAPELRAALDAARGGTLCVWAERPPDGFGAWRERMFEPAADVRLAICARPVDDVTRILAEPIAIPPLAERGAELEGVIDGYIEDARAALRATVIPDPRDRAWIRRYADRSLPQIERAALRLVALREAGGVTRAAARLGISHVALSRWLARRHRP
jgi:hypothetical protein